MKVLWAVLLAAATALAEPVARGPLAQANTALQVGEADKALSLLDPVVRRDEGPAEAHNLKCRVLLTLEKWDEAAGECEQAVKLDGQNPSFHLWLGRALGERASRASFLSAFSLAKRVRNEFEEAVRLSPRNGEALADLGEFYQSAPGVVGGGLGKAEGVAAQLEKLDSARGHKLRGLIAEDHKDFGTAEREYKQAIAAASQPALQWMWLAGFYRRRQQWDQMESAIRSGQNVAERSGRGGLALYDGASMLRETHRDPARAAKLLEEYLAGPGKTEIAPTFVAHTWLAILKIQMGDLAAATREQAAALALAHEYKPAQDLKH